MKTTLILINIVLCILNILCYYTGNRLFINAFAAGFTAMAILVNVILKK